MKLEIDIPEHHYNNIMALDSVSLGRVPYKGIIMYTINAIKHGKVLEQEPNIKALGEELRKVREGIKNEMILGNTSLKFNVNSYLGVRGLLSQ